MKEEAVTVRIDKKLAKGLEELSKARMEGKSEIVRGAIEVYIRKEKESTEIKKMVARKFAEGKIGFDELVKVLGYEEAKTVAFYTDVARKSFEEGL